MGGYRPNMSVLTAKVENDHGRVSTKSTETLPAKADGLFTILNLTPLPCLIRWASKPLRLLLTCSCLTALSAAHRLDASVLYSELYSFGASTINQAGWGPQGLIEATDGFLYGTTLIGPSGSIGAVFRVTKEGDGYTNLHQFSGSGADAPYSGVIEGTDGFLYGITSGFAATNRGVIFRIAKDGSSHVVLHRFTSAAG